MAQITLIFNEEEREDAELAMKARAMHGILRELDDELRSRVKYEEPSDEARTTYEDNRELLIELIQEARLPF
jgi:hypothetical protein